MYSTEKLANQIASAMKGEGYTDVEISTDGIDLQTQFFIGANTPEGLPLSIAISFTEG